MPEPSIDTLKRPIPTINALRIIMEKMAQDASRILGEIALRGATVEEIKAAEDLADALAELDKAAMPIHNSITELCDSEVSETPETKAYTTQEATTQEEPITDEQVATTALQKVASKKTRSIPDRKKIETDTKEPVVLNELEQAILAFALKGAFRTEELREAIAAIKALDAPDYLKFKSQSFAETRERIIHHLAQNGQAASWAETGAKRGKRYQLLTDFHPKTMTEQLPSPTTEPTHTVSKTKATAPKPQAAVIQKHNLDFTPPQHILEKREKEALREKIYAIVDANIDNMGLPSDANGKTASQIALELSARIKEHQSDCKSVIRRLKSEGKLHTIGHTNGMALLSRIPVEIGTKKQRVSAEKNTPPDKDTWQPYDSDVLETTIELLLELKHVQQYIDYKEIASKAANTANISEEEARKALRRLERAGYIRISQIRRTGGPHSTQSHASVIRLRDQRLKDQCRQDLAAVIKVFSELPSLEPSR